MSRPGCDHRPTRSSKPAHRLTVIPRLFGHRITQGVPVLQELNEQHRLQLHRRPPPPSAKPTGSAARSAPVSASKAPRHQGTHLRQKPLAPCHLLLHRVAKAGNGRLLGHQRVSLSRCFRTIRSPQKWQAFQTFLSTPTNFNRKSKEYQATFKEV